MSLFDDAAEDVKEILVDQNSASVSVLITSAPPDNVEYGTLDPLDIDNQIRGFMGDHYSQVDVDTGIPQEGLNAKVTFAIKTLLEKGVIDSASDPDFEDFKIEWLDPASGESREFLVDTIRPSRSLGHIVLILGELEETP